MSGSGKSHPKIHQVKYVNDKLLFPISWLQKQDYCEYQIYLENIKCVQVKPSAAMVEGTQEHERLYSEFAEKAVPATLDQMFAESRVGQILSRELRVEDPEHGLYGYIDEVWLTPDNFVVIDDKPGFRAFKSNIHQVFGYCLAFSTMVPKDNRQMIAALRERGTGHIFWQSSFDRSAQDEIIEITNHIHDLLTGKAKFSPSGNANKCRSCRLQPQCDRVSR